MEKSNRIVLGRKPEPGDAKGVFYFQAEEIYFYDLWIAMPDSNDAYQWGTINRLKDEDGRHTYRWGVTQILEDENGKAESVEVGRENEAVGFAISRALGYRPPKKEQAKDRPKLRLVGGTEA